MVMLNVNNDNIHLVDVLQYMYEKVNELNPYDVIQVGPSGGGSDVARQCVGMAVVDADVTAVV